MSSMGINILVTGAKGFLGRNLVENLKCIRDGRNRTRPALDIGEIYEYDLGNTPEELDSFCARCGFVFHLAGVNRPKDAAEFMAGNFGFTDDLLKRLDEKGNRAPVVITSSVQATLAGRFGNSEYGRSKLAGEERMFAYGQETGAPVYVYRLCNLVGKWVRPNYNSAVGTFCSNIANDLPITVNDPAVELEMVFAEDLIEEFYDCMEGKPHRCRFEGTKAVADPSGKYCYCPVIHRATLGRITELLYSFRDQPRTLMMPSIPAGSFEKKLYSMYLSYLPKEKAAFELTMKEDERGSFTELLKTADHGQFSVNISKPGITKGQHWHNSKWEFFIVVSGHGLIQERKIGTDEILEFEVSGDRIRAVHMLPGYTHNIINLSETENLVTVMWANEPFDPEKPDTFFEKV